jgi:glycosyltransferase involved in cell wall biosynthesis
MKIGMYIEPGNTSFGGADFLIAVAAQALRGNHQVEIIHHREWMTAAKLSNFFQLDLDGISLRYCPPSKVGWLALTTRWWRLRAEQKAWNAHLSAPYDLFINSTHGIPPFCHAPRGVLYVLFPTFNRSAEWPWCERCSFGFRGAKVLLKRAIYDRLWKERLASYQRNLAITQFSARWATEMWGSRWDVLYPPVLVDFEEKPKVDRVVALGRFTPMKQQHTVISTFCKHVTGALPEWSLSCIGGLGSSEDYQRYFQQVRALASESPSVSLQPNASRSDLRDALQGGKVFWHAVGYGVDEEREPGELEHFGIATVEAMAAGCVPVVINRGGQREIIQHGESGYLCESPEEMAAYTRRLAHDESLRVRMAVAARVRAAEFSRSRFVERFLDFLKPLLH